METRRTQPYRATAGRREGPALHAMQRGGSPLMQSPGDVRKAAMKRKVVHPSRGTRGTPLDAMSSPPDVDDLGGLSRHPGCRALAGVPLRPSLITGCWQNV